MYIHNIHTRVVRCLGHRLRARLRHESPYVQDGSAQNFVQGVGLIGQKHGCVLEKKGSKNTLRGRVTTPADLDPPCRVRVGVRVRVKIGAGLIWADVRG